MLNKIITLAIAAGIATVSYAEGNTPAPAAAPAAKAGVPAAAVGEKKVEGAKAAEPGKTELAKGEPTGNEAKPLKVKEDGKKPNAPGHNKAEPAAPVAK